MSGGVFSLVFFPWCTCVSISIYPEFLCEGCVWVCIYPEFLSAGVKGVSYSVLDEVCSRLGVCHILLVEGGNKDIHRRIQLNISQSDVMLALREHYEWLFYGEGGADKAEYMVARSIFHL